MDSSWQIEKGQGGFAGQQGHGLLWEVRIIHIDYLKRGKTIANVYYAEPLERFDVDLKKKTCEFAEENSTLPPG